MIKLMIALLTGLEKCLRIIVKMNNELIDALNINTIIYSTSNIVLLTFALLIEVLLRQKSQLPHHFMAVSLIN
jgi:hypothetical protein